MAERLWKWYSHGVCNNNSGIQGVADGGAAPRALAPDEAAMRPPAAVVSIKLRFLYPQAMINSRAERVRLVNKDLRKGKPPGVHHPIWDHFSVYVKEAYNCFSVCLLCDRLGHQKQAKIKFSNGSPTILLHPLNTAKKGHKKTSRTNGGPLSP